jgi:hypothetical protein
MYKSRADYLTTLSKHLKNHPQRDDIVQEYETFMEDKLFEYMQEGYSEQQAEARLIQEQPHPRTIASQFQNTKPPKLKQIMYFTLFINLLFFAIGGILTLGNHQYSNEALTVIWSTLTELHWYVLLLYSTFIVTLGFLLGKEYGAKFNAYIQRILIVTLTPNLVFMTGILYAWIPRAWFEPMLTPDFVISCVFITMLYYPLSKMAYRLGQLQI